MNKEADSLLEASCRVALAAYLHDLGKFAERADMEVDKNSLEDHLQLYARKKEAGGRSWYSHRHSAYTALAWDLIEKTFPKLIGDDVTPFGSWGDVEVDDSVINAAALHHKPETFLQWIVATADRVASGFEREEFEKYNNPVEKETDKTREGRNHFTARLLTLFEQIRIGADNEAHRDKLEWRYPLAPLSVKSIFPCKAESYETANKHKARSEYNRLWRKFEQSLQEIPAAYRSSWPLWLDHFDSAWACYTQAIPSATAFNVRPEVSLYDHSCTTAALATSLWRYHHELDHDTEKIAKALSDFERPDWSEQKLLLIQGDFFGIQNFLFATGGETQKKAAKLLRGRSFYVSLLTECAALKILEELQLPPTSQVINAAGKFLIVAPNTPRTVAKLKQVQSEIDQWFLQHTYGQSGIGMAALPASCNDFLRTSGQGKSPFAMLVERLFEALNTAKAQRLGLCGEHPPGAIFEEFLTQFDQQKGACAIDGLSPAIQKLKGSDKYVSALSQDQVDTGAYLAHHNRVLLTTESFGRNSLQLPIFGLHVQFTGSEEASGQFGRLAREGKLLRAWDFSLPDEEQSPLFNGYARRAINGYVPRFGELNAWEKGRYDGLDEAQDSIDSRAYKSLEFIARDDRWPLPDSINKYRGEEALVTLKGDVDDLGKILQSGLAEPSFAKMAALSRQVNAFFSVWLPWYCQQHYKSTYTVFAGGDDFFLIGPWRSTIRLALDMRQHFANYVTGNKEIHFSAGLSMTKPGMPIRHMGEMAEDALDRAKGRKNGEGLVTKNAVTCFGYTVSWDEFSQLLAIADELESMRQRMELSTGYLYGLQYLADMAEDIQSGRPQLESALWNSRFNYRTWRMLESKRGLKEADRRHWHSELGRLLGGGIEKYGGAFKIALFTHLYHHRH